jgi:hypothetical protein
MSNIILYNFDRILFNFYQFTLTLAEIVKSKMPDQNLIPKTACSLDWKEHIRMRPGMYIGS